MNRESRLTDETFFSEPIKTWIRYALVRTHRLAKLVNRGVDTHARGPAPNRLIDKHRASDLVLVLGAVISERYIC